MSLSARTDPAATTKPPPPTPFVVARGMLSVLEKRQLFDVGLSAEGFNAVRGLLEVIVPLPWRRLWTAGDSERRWHRLTGLTLYLLKHSVSIDVEKHLVADTTSADHADVVRRIIFRVLNDFGKLRARMSVPLWEHAALFGWTHGRHF